MVELLVRKPDDLDPAESDDDESESGWPGSSAGAAVAPFGFFAAAITFFGVGFLPPPTPFPPPLVWGARAISAKFVENLKENLSRVKKLSIIWPPRTQTTLFETELDGCVEICSYDNLFDTIFDIF